MSSRFLKQLRRRLLRTYYGRRRYTRHYGRAPNLRHPRLFSEHIYAYKLWPDSRMAARTGKVLAKELARERLGDDWIIPNLWHGPRLPPRDERNWPVPFIVKASHGSSWNAFVRSEADLDWDYLEARCEKWLSRTYGRSTMEPHYAGIVPQVLVESLLGDPEGTPKDYRFHVFGGRVEFIRVHTVDEDDHSEINYDRDWNELPFRLKKPQRARDSKKPDRLLDMIAAAETLAEGFPFMRVDFFIFDGQPRFGEMAFTPSAGDYTITPPQYDEILGRLWPRG